MPTLDGQDIAWPVVFDEHGDLRVFRSLETAQDYIEAIDVDEGEYVAYDCEGRLLALATRSGLVMVSLAEAEPTHYEHVRQLMIGYLAHFDVPMARIADMSLPELMKEWFKLQEQWADHSTSCLGFLVSLFYEPRRKRRPDAPAASERRDEGNNGKP